MSVITVYKRNVTVITNCNKNKLIKSSIRIRKCEKVLFQSASRISECGRTIVT